MSTLWKTTVVEAKLLLREPKTMLLGIAFPTVIMLVLGAIPALRVPSEQFGGARFVDLWAPTSLVMGMATLGLQHIPGVLATYRENGVLRRLSTTPVHPVTILVAQLAAALAAAVASAVLLIVTARLVLGVALPRDPWGFALAFLLGLGAVLAIGMLIAAVARNARVAGTVAVLAFMLVMFAGGVYLPRFLMPGFLQRLGDYTPPGVQSLLDAWSGNAAAGPQFVQPAIMALIALAAGGAAARLFRWE